MKTRRIKRRMAAVLVSLALSVSLTVPIYAAANICANPTEIQAGDSVTVTLVNANELHNIVALDYRVYYDKSCFSFQQGQAGTVQATGIGNDNQATQVSFDYGESGTGALKADANGDFIAVNVADFCSNGNGLTIAPGDLYTLTFTANTDITEEQITKFSVRLNKVMNTTYGGLLTSEDVLSQTDLEVAAGVNSAGCVVSITINGQQQAVKGDVSEDGTVDVEDVAMINQSLLPTDHPLYQVFTDAQTRAADVNGDGLVDVEDVAMINQSLLPTDHPLYQSLD